MSTPLASLNGKDVVLKLIYLKFNCTCIQKWRRHMLVLIPPKPDELNGACEWKITSISQLYPSLFPKILSTVLR